MTTSATLRVALLQLDDRGPDPDANRQHADGFLQRAAGQGAALALLPELWSHGYRPFEPEDVEQRRTWLARAVPRDGDWLTWFRERARALRMAIAVTYLERWPEAPRNTLTLLDARGDEVLTYAKAHLCPWGPPDTACARGDGFPVATLVTPAGPVRVGAMICFDREFPETARLLALAGAELILVPNACDLASDREVGDLRIAQLRSRAFENGVAIALANYPAPRFDGHSLAVREDGSIVAMGGAEEGIVMADVDLAFGRSWRQREAGRTTTRRPELYGPLATSPTPLR